MNLYERSATLGVALDTANEASGDHELVERGRAVINLLDTSTATLVELAALRQALDLGPLALETKTLNQSARQLRTGFTKHQAKALHHASTDNFEKAVRNCVGIATRWAKARWRDSFGPWAEQIAQVEGGRLVGDANRRRQVERVATKLKALMACDPLADRAQIVELLGGVEMDGWPAAIAALGDELTVALRDLEDQRQALSPEVRTALARAGDVDGLPLDEVSPELLEHLRAAGVLGSLVVRRS